MAVPSPVAGVLTILVEADAEVEVGATVGEIDTNASAPKQDAPQQNSATSQTSAEHDDAGTPPEDASSDAPAASSDATSPAVRRLLEENGLDAATVAKAVDGTGKDGRLVKADVDRYLAERSTAGASVDGRPPASDTGTSAPPAARARDDVQSRVAMSTLRKRIAENLVRSKQESAHLTTFNEVDMSGVMEIRSRYKERFEKRHEIRLGFMSFFLKAAQRALIEFPEVNAFVDGTDIIYNYFYNIGVAISTDAGLIVPVIRNVDTLGFAEIEKMIIDFATRAKQKRIMPDEFAGGTFTITNGGVFGSMLSTPIPGPPQTAVLGMHSIKKRPVVVDDEITVRPMMYLALTYDHRIIDGRQAIGFLNRIREQIEDPVQFLLEI
jgi:2-oxoglutarate dehydrogenase E2 component (dihydrolipoamide succinyltransferase)